jgi:hypothetical protein
MRVKLVNALPLRHPDNKNRVITHRAGEVLEVPDEIAERALELGSAVRVDENDEAEVPEEGEDVELPVRPSNGAPKDVWRTYLTDLGNVTRELGPLEVPEGATRDHMIALGDQRVADWNEA